MKPNLRWVVIVAALACLGGAVWSQVTTRPASGPAPRAPAVSSLFPPQPLDPVERPEFRGKAHPLVKSITSINALVVSQASDGTYLGKITDIIATVPPETRTAVAAPVGRGLFTAPPSAVLVPTKQAQIGQEMKTSFDEAIKAVRMRYPLWEPGRIDVSFGDKYTAHDGGSAGTAFATLMLSELEGFEIDSKCAITGDISIDWKVRKIGGACAKIRGAIADRCACVAIPDSNESVLDDMFLLYQTAPLAEIQIFSISTLQQAVAIMRTDRAPQLVEAMKQFAAIQQRLKLGRAILNNPDIQKALEQVVALAPNHLSASHLLAIAHNNGPTTLSTYATMSELTPVVMSHWEILFLGATPSRALVTSVSTSNAQKVINKLRPIAAKEVLPLVSDLSAIVVTSENIAAGRMRPSEIEARRKQFLDHLETLSADKELMAKMIREGGF